MPSQHNEHDGNGCRTCQDARTALLFFGAFLPQFIDPTRDYGLQILIMGVTAMALAAMTDSVYAFASGRAGSVLSRKRIRLLTRTSGGFLIGGGLWLAFSRR